MATIEISPYDPRWVADFEAERARLEAALGALAHRIDHHGSTAVPGLAAKPIIDIQISVNRLRPLELYKVPLVRMGYVHVPHADDDFCPFFHRPAGWPHSHHVHLVTAGGAEERRTLAFRDYLRDHPTAAREYEALKRELASRADTAQPGFQDAYAAAKGGFVERIVGLALADGYPRGRGTPLVA
jgi:GrpB-like predicted nucleotidyltransferase (UPF0157 family)